MRLESIVNEAESALTNMNITELTHLINRERELDEELKNVQLEIVKHLTENEAVDIYSGEIYEGAIVTMTETRVKVTHTEGMPYSFIRPDADVVISAVPRSAKRKGGKPRSKNPSKAALAMRASRERKLKPQTNTLK